MAGTGLRDWALAEQGRSEEGTAQLRQGMVVGRATAAEARRPYWLILLAEAYGKANRLEEGLTILAEALAAIYKTGEHFYEAELYRLRGELTLAQSNVQSVGSRVQKSSAFGVRHPRSGGSNIQPLIPNTQDEAEACFFKAIEIARQQSAKSFELRAVMSLARLRRQQGKRREAHSILTQTYTWFTEGFDTKDLQEAKTLLDELAV